MISLISSGTFALIIYFSFFLNLNISPSRQRTNEVQSCTRKILKSGNSNLAQHVDWCGHLLLRDPLVPELSFCWRTVSNELLNIDYTVNLNSIRQVLVVLAETRWFVRKLNLTFAASLQPAGPAMAGCPENWTIMWKKNLVNEELNRSI